LKKSIARIDLGMDGKPAPRRGRLPPLSFCWTLDVVRSEGVWIVAAALALVFFHPASRLPLVRRGSSGAFALAGALLWIADCYRF
jgi:hypothetical protein